LRHLSESYRDCFVFAVGEGDRCFVGATPERLARVRDGLVSTMSVAGTIRRGATPEEDKALGDYLLGSVKDNVEHAPVVRAIVEALGDLCEDLDVGKSPSLIKLGNLQHLYTPVSARLSGEHTLLDVIERLHPTPAVGGWPLDIALQIIGEREGFDRGWYAGPVGWMDQNGDGDFAVALRSALLCGSQATLFAGCGIVADSNPEREYAESCLKLKPMLSALDAE
jgi:isochorismate synthase